MNFLEISGLILWFCILCCILFVIMCAVDSKDAPVIEDEEMEYGKPKKQNHG